VQECLSGGDVACLDGAVNREDYDYIYVSKILHADNCISLAPQEEFPYFVENLKMHVDFDIVYESDEVLISRQE
jgi:hypothetical protein